MPEQLELISVAEPATDGPDLNRLHVRESKRARRMFLHVRPPLGVELVVPRGTRPKIVQSFVEENNEWIDAAWKQIESEYIGDRSARPDSVHLGAIGQQLSIAYQLAPKSRSRWHRSTNSIQLRCRTADFSDAPPILRAWLMSEARRILPDWVMREADKVGNRPKRVQVRLQRTRWGSCSSTGTISVNAALLFLAPELTRYLIIHELCHMRHMNHSRTYWQHVARFEPAYRRLDQELSESWQRIPWWAMAD